MRHKCCRTPALNGFGHYLKQVEKFRNKMNLRSRSVTPGWSALLKQANQATIQRNWTSGVVQSQYLRFLCPMEKSAFITSHCLPHTVHVPELLPSNENSLCSVRVGPGAHTTPGHPGLHSHHQLGKRNRAEPQNRGHHEVLNKAILTFCHILNAPRTW